MTRVTLFLAVCAAFIAVGVTYPIEYNDSENRALFTLAAHTFSAKGIACVEKAYPEPNRKYRVFFHSATYVAQLSTNVSTVVYIDNPTKSIVVAIGVFESQDENVLKGRLLYNEPVDFHNYGNVDQIFVNILDLKWPFILKQIEKPDFSAYTVTYTGYSIGGAVATLAAMRTLTHQHRSSAALKLVTFGSPRVGDLTFASSVDREIPTVYRVTHRSDPVVHWPPCDETSQGGCSLNTPEAPHHFGTEIFYNNGMDLGANFTRCTNSDEDTQCSDAKTSTHSFNDHLWYFQHKVIVYGQNDCTDVAGAQPSTAGVMPVTIATIFITLIGGLMIA